uniref:EGF-like domain-containing protein n=1 Tax=Plectus sambesii TaxID=2011161 RepID=A0A914WAD4_9BILA
MQITFALLLCLACAFARPQHSKRHRRHQEHTMNENGQVDNDNSGNVVERFIPIETCDVSSPCSDHGVCIFMKKGVARCHCEEGYFGARCEIAPIGIKRCFLSA